eukprot:464501-Rhodomonas_salina.3
MVPRVEARLPDTRADDGREAGRLGGKQAQAVSEPRMLASQGAGMRGGRAARAQHAAQSDTWPGTDSGTECHLPRDKPLPPQQEQTQHASSTRCRSACTPVLLVAFGFATRMSPEGGSRSTCGLTAGGLSWHVTTHVTGSRWASSGSQGACLRASAPWRGARACGACPRGVCVLPDDARAPSRRRLAAARAGCRSGWGWRARGALTLTWGATSPPAPPPPLALALLLGLCLGLCFCHGHGHRHGLGHGHGHGSHGRGHGRRLRRCQDALAPRARARGPLPRVGAAAGGGRAWL